MLLVSCPPYSFIICRLDELRNMEIPTWADRFVRAPRFLSHHIYCGATFSSIDCHVPCLCWPHVCVFLEFPAHWIHFFFIKKPSHILLLLLHYTLSLESETKREFLHLLYGKTHFPPLMVDFDFIKNETPFVSFFFARLKVFLESSSGRRPHVGLFVPRDCGAFRPILISLYPLLCQSLIAHHLKMIAIEYRDSDVRSNVLETGLSSSGESSNKDFEIVVSKPPSSSKPFSSSKVHSSSIPFHALFESYLLASRHLKSIHKRFQFPEGVAIRLPRPNEKVHICPWRGEFLRSYLFMWPLFSNSSLYYATPFYYQCCT